jgi:hypothetical protein
MDASEERAKILDATARIVRENALPAALARRRAAERAGGGCEDRGFARRVLSGFTGGARHQNLTRFVISGGADNSAPPGL